MARAELERIGRAGSVMAEFPEMLYLYDRPSILDAPVSATVLNLAPTPIGSVLAETAA
ncbi:hypothetical protein [Streptomyces rubellomurinus]|uniref:hypothetical protein n=1 Tax=Streptomyces rubellomurinus (strain ATCC 31215) TaxID=359131 RepID=UPI000AAD626A|nr:hypothetical protein [Streptomyces rubellomurinus]